jgi:hypothetical protein
MKAWIWDNYPKDQMSYNQLRKVVKEAWEAVPEDFLIELLRSMKACCEAVITANRMHIKY